MSDEIRTDEEVEAHIGGSVIENPVLDGLLDTSTIEATDSDEPDVEAHGGGGVLESFIENSKSGK